MRQNGNGPAERHRPATGAAGRVMRGASGSVISLKKRLADSKRVFGVFSMNVGASLMVAVISYNVVERPFLRLNEGALRMKGLLYHY